MKKNFIFLLLIFFLIILINLFINDFVKSEQAKFNQIYPVISPAGFLCLFDQRDGKIYIYDTNFSKCKFILQLNKLGEPLERIR